MRGSSESLALPLCHPAPTLQFPNESDEEFGQRETPRFFSLPRLFLCIFYVHIQDLRIFVHRYNNMAGPMTPLCRRSFRQVRTTMVASPDCLIGYQQGLITICPSESNMLVPHSILDQFARIPHHTTLKNRYYGVFNAILTKVTFTDPHFFIEPPSSPGSRCPYYQPGLYCYLCCRSEPATHLLP